jgi:ribosome-binding factor A
MKRRQLRLNELLKRELSSIVARELTFPDALVSLNHVEVTPDLKKAHVFVSVLGSTEGATVIHELELHRAAFQAELSRRVVLKYTPHLAFHLDESIQRGARVIEILQEIETRPEQSQ